MYSGCLKNLKVTINSEDISYKIDVEQNEGVELITFHFVATKKMNFPKIKIDFQYPFTDIIGLWRPNSFRNKGYSLVWNDPNDDGPSTKGTSSAPVGCFFSANDENRFTVAYSEALQPVTCVLGVREEEATIHGKAVLFKVPIREMEEYSFTMRIDTRAIPFYEAIGNVTKWYESFEMYRPTEPTKDAMLPMYSTWYSFHQEVTAKGIEEECEAFKAYGCEGVIVDDGWQTEDNSRGYAYCGDWEVAKNKIPNMKDHVKRVHEIGMKYLLWYSVPHVGLKSKIYDKFKDKTLFIIDRHQAGILDPRYKEVRDYIINTYKRAVLEWDIDGLKLDFMGNFNLTYATGNALEKDERRDFESLQEAVDRLLEDVMKELKMLKSDFMIEFRQFYIGPCMRKYGNIFRVVDCPTNYVNNRMGSIDIRMFSGNTTVHSDMIMWSKEDSKEHAAMQMINILFSVPQISVKHHQIPEEHRETLKHWLKFWLEHREILLEGDLKPINPVMHYPIVKSQLNNELLVAFYGDMVCHVDEVFDKLTLVNGTMKDRLTLRFNDSMGKVNIRVYDCCGKLTNEIEEVISEGVFEINSELSGYCEIVKVEA